MKNIFKRFFNKFFFIGLIIILASIIIDLWFGKSFFKDLATNGLSTVGVALLIGSVFDFSKNSTEFMDFVSNILKEIIVSKNFLKGLEDKEKGVGDDINTIRKSVGAVFGYRNVFPKEDR